jgi:transposase
MPGDSKGSVDRGPSSNRAENWARSLALCQPEFDEWRVTGFSLDKPVYEERPDVPMKKYRVALSAEERMTLKQLLRSGKAGTRKLTRARILLKADDGLSDEEIAAALAVGTATVRRMRQRFVEAHLGALDEHVRPGAQRKLTAKQEAHVIAVAYTPAPEGHARWTLRLLAEKVVEMGFVASISHETVRQVLKKTNQIVSAAMVSAGSE